ncbi:protein-L-isoaspartate O-methyltransferase [Terasakiispira papahanaumokuakeensis]|uniref:Protein-L-isoaspartate O-methyltransferase n=1 Tax=Terasakiispira papahanaumokuakeensis TaxID=197479 RepID=A0A1E2VBA6_9GAMM|nr:protein-L-isoaspartate(D-aspartate) O-methyltransferase [Terasakiispira papahanaumokuakeensis]ODC04261.1 protein-L-isoaspartate O-methyltransferase [Terasakiispira papahanaumokuakeensis]
MAGPVELTPELLGIGFTSQRTRNRMVDRLEKSGVRHPQVLEVMRTLPRHLFVDEALAHRAYEDTALPIGLGQTLSHPLTVARMSERLMSNTPQRVLEIGTGSGFQCAVLACLVPQVWSIERLAQLQKRARERLRRLGLHNVHLRHTDGQWGWPDKAPFDAILVTAAAPRIPQALLEQLAIGGQLLIPVGDDQKQSLWQVSRLEQGFEHQELDPVHFVPLKPGQSN